MKLLFDHLRTWKGPDFVDHEISKRGYLVHKVYQHEMIEFCRTRLSDNQYDLTQYWREFAREVVFSGGRNLLSLRDDWGCRSAYLDTMAHGLGIKPLPRSMSMHPCIHARVEANERNELLWNQLLDNVEKVKSSEVDAHEIDATHWTGLKAGIVPIVEDQAMALGFEKRKVPLAQGVGQPRKTFWKETKGGLLIGCGVDTGGLPRATQLHLQCYVTHKSDFSTVFWIGDCRNIVPGFELYNIFRVNAPPPSRVLGIHAFLELLDVFTDSFA